jgi:hypothetical protein
MSSEEEAAWEGGLVGGEEAVVVERRRQPLGALLVEAGVASEAQVREALDEGNRTGERLGQVVLRRGWISERKLTKLLAEQWGLRAPGTAKTQVDPAALARIDAGLAAELGGIPFAFDDDGLVVAVEEPKTDRFEAFRALLGNVSFVVVAPSTLTELLDTRAAMFETTSSPVERVGAWLRPPTENPHAAEQTQARDLPDHAQLDDVDPANDITELVEETSTRDIPGHAPPDEGQFETESAHVVDDLDPSDTPHEAPFGVERFAEQPMSAIQQRPEDTQQATRLPTFSARPQPGSVVEHLQALVSVVEALDHELTATRRRLQAQDTELAELRRARASDLDTISNLGTELERWRRRMEELQTVTRQLADELDK